MKIITIYHVRGFYVEFELEYLWNLWDKNDGVNANLI